MKTTQITENAVRNHGQLYRNHEFKLQKTDPGFIELFDNWAFDEVGPPTTIISGPGARAHNSEEPRNSQAGLTNRKR